MENMDSPQASGSIGKELKDFRIDIDQPNRLHVEWPECCIYRVPKKLRKVNKEAYTPKLVSIGPYHHGRKELRDMENLKLTYLKEFLYRTTQSQEKLLDFILDKEEKIRRFYSEKCRLKHKEFVQMILLDAVFIIELFRRKKYHDENDYILNKPWLANGIQHDLILLENQLPFFLLGKLYMLAFTDSATTFLELSLNYFDSYGKQKPKLINCKEAKHLTDLIRYFFIVPDLKPTKYMNNLYSATKLDDAGLKFKAAKERHLLEIKLHQNNFLGLFRCFDCSWLLACLPCLKCFPCLERRQCILEVPPFEIHDDTEALFRNLMALEQCHYPSHTYICNYVVLLDCLIDTEQDVDLLVDKKVIVNQLGRNAAVATLFNRLGLQIVETRSCYHDLAQKLNQHYDYPLNRILATLTSVYFRDFWRGSTTVVGLIVLCFTFWNFLKPFVI